MKIKLPVVLFCLLTLMAQAPNAVSENTVGPALSTDKNLANNFLPEDNLKTELRDLHENLRRTESTLGEIEREAGRRQMIANPLSNNDTFISDPWSACMPANRAALINDSTRPGPYLKCRPAYLKLSLAALDALTLSTDTIIGKLADLTGGANSNNRKDKNKALVDIDVLKDGNGDFKQKLVALRSLCQASDPDNALILTAVHTLKETLDGLDAVGKRLWKV